MNPVILGHLTMLDVAPPDVIRHAAEAGFRHVSLRLRPTFDGGVGYPLMTDRAMMRETRSRMAATGVSVVDLESVRLHPETDIASLTPFLEAGAELGATELLVPGDDPDMSRLTDNLAMLCDAAARYGMRANLEFVPFFAVKSLADAMKAVSAVGKPNAGVLVDTLHVDRGRENLEDIRRIPHTFLNYCHFCDAGAVRPDSDAGLNEESSQRRLFPGEGNLDLIEMLLALPEDLPLSVEVGNPTLRRQIGPAEMARRAYQSAISVVQKSASRRGALPML